MIVLMLQFGTIIHNGHKMTEEQLTFLINETEKKYKLEKTKPHNTDNFASFIPQLIDNPNVDSTEFYQWFCPIWQATVSLFSDVAEDDDWCELF